MPSCYDSVVQMFFFTSDGPPQCCPPLIRAIAEIKIKFDTMNPNMLWALGLQVVSKVDKFSSSTS